MVYNFHVIFIVFNTKATREGGGNGIMIFSAQTPKKMVFKKYVKLLQK